MATSYPLLFNIFIYIYLLTLVKAQDFTSTNGCVIETLSVNDDEESNALEEFFSSLDVDGQLDCVYVFVEPGLYVVNNSYSFVGVRNLTIHGIRNRNGVPRVTFTRTDSTSSSTSSLSSFIAEDLEYLEFFGINFNGSAGFISFVNISTLVIRNNIFRNFEQGAINLYDCQNVRIENSQFIENGRERIRRFLSLQGGAGGLSIQYLNNKTQDAPEFLIRNTTFRRNIAGLNPNFSDFDFTEVTNGEQYTGRGGAIFILSRQKLPIEGRIESCIFSGNNASFYGGAIYIAFNSLSENNITIANSNFSRNSAFTAGGAIMVSYQEGGDDDNVNGVEMWGCRFIGNRAEYGGAVYFFVSITSGREDGELGTFMRFSSCIFMSNNAPRYGSAIGATALNLFESKEETRPAEINNCLFIDNMSQDGTTIGITNFPFIFQGVNRINNSTGPGLIVVGAKVIFSGNISFINNNSTLQGTGVLLFLSNGQIELKKYTYIDIRDNRGSWGAGIVPIISSTPSSFEKLIGNPLCSFVYEDPTVPPDDWQVNINLDGNNAVVGSAVYANALHLCSWTGGTNFDTNRAYRWNFLKLGPNNRNQATLGRRDSVANSVQAQAVTTTTATNRIEGFPGSSVRLNISSFGETNNLTYAIWSFQSARNDTLVFDPSAVPARKNLYNSITLSFFLTESLSLGPQNRREFSVIAHTILNERESSTLFTVSVRGCPAGTILERVPGNELYSCQCNTDRSDISQCVGNSVFISVNKWAALSHIKEADGLYVYDCPAGYCKCSIIDDGGVFSCLNEFQTDYPDGVCSCDRKGILCGECVNGTGVSVLLNKCTDCNDANSILIVLLIIYDCLIFTWVFVSPYMCPEWYYASLFYLQFLPLFTLYFPQTFERSQPILYYIVSFLSFYFPYDFCLYSGMTTLVSYGLKFIPCICALIIIPTATLIRDFILKTKLKRQPHYGVFDIVLSIYTPTLYAALSVLNCPRVPVTTNNTTTLELRWFHDGSVKCFTGGHLALSLFSMIVILSLSSFIVGFIILSFDKIQGHRCFHFSALSLRHQYKEDSFYWGSVELLKRTILVVTIVVMPSNINVFLITIALFLGIQSIKAPYKTTLGNLTHLVQGCLTFVILLVSTVRFFLEDFHTNQYSFNGSDVGMIPEDSKCDVDLKMTPLVKALTVLYYLPLAFVVTVAVCFWSYTIYNYIKQKRAKKLKLQEARRLATLQRVVSTKGDVREQRTRTRTTNIPRSHSEAPISPSKLDEAIEIDWTPISYREDRHRSNEKLVKTSVV